MKQKIPTSADVRLRMAPMSHAQMQELSRKSSVPFTTLWKIRNGETANPGLETVGQFYNLIPIAKKPVAHAQGVA